MAERRRLITRRRYLLATAGAALGGVGGAVYAFRIEPHWVRVVERDLPIAHLPDALIGKRLVQISDLHIGPIVDDDYMKSALARVGELEPDVLVITGDFITYRGAQQFDQADRVLDSLALGKLATVAILGNHDYGPRWSDLTVADTITARLETRGITVLRNQVIDVEGLTIAGIDDYWSPRYEPASVMSALPAGRATLVLSHNPDTVDTPEWANYTGWTLSGHTHGGQCSFPLIGAPLLPVKNKTYTRGAFNLPTGGQLYINPGLGYLRKVRFNVRPEITAFALRRQA